MRAVVKILQFLFLLVLTIVVILAIFTKVSPNLQHFAIKVGGSSDTDYLVFDIITRQGFRTDAQYTTANDVKEAGFSSDSTKFAAVYHYGSPSRYTWIGIWDTKSGKLIDSFKKDGWTTDLSGVFDR